MGYRILSVASEWYSYHGGLSTFNRSFCAALASAGHDVTCLIPRATQAEHDDAKRVGIRLRCPDSIPGLSDEALLCLSVELGGQPDIVVGHGHVTGAVAAARVRQFHPTAQRIHVLHTLPDEIEPFKDREGEDPAQRAHRKQATETALSRTASLAVAVGPRLHRQWSTHIGGAQSGVGVHRLTPGLSDLRRVGSIPQANWCLLMGRLEDAVLKGVNLASAALGIINKDRHFRGSREVTLVLRGAEVGTSNELRNYVHKHAKAKIPCTIREYTYREDQVREDVARSSIVLMPSQMEGFGLVGLEALALGVPILISQRSGLGELLLELIDADPALEFARRFVVDVGEGSKKDAERWAEAIRGVLTDRDRAFRDAAVLREAILKADYWSRAVSDLFGVLKIPPRDPKTPPDTPPDLTQRAHKLLEIDPATAIVYSSSLLESEMERVATSKGIAKPALPASQYIELLLEKGLLDSVEADLAKNVLHLRNKAAHTADATFTKDMAAEHMRFVEALVQKLKRKESGEASIERYESDIRLGASSKELGPLIQTAVTDANAEIDVAVARMNAGELEIAIHILEELRKKRWDTLTPREKYRVAANVGLTLERKGEFRRAAQFYLEAKQHQPDDEKARTFEAIAYFHLDDKAKAYELAGEIIKDYPNCSIAVAVRIRSAPPDVPISTLEALVPAALHEELDIVHALGWRALGTGDLVAAERIATDALKRHPDSVEIKEQLAVVCVQEGRRARLANRPVNTERLEQAVEDLTTSLTKQRDRREESRLRYMRAEAYDLLGRTEDAETDFRAAFDCDKEESDVVRRFVLFLERHDRTDAAIELLRQSDTVKKNHTNRLMLSGLLGDRKGEGDWDAAIALLRETIPEKPEPEIRAAMVAHLTQLLGLQKKHDEALAYLDGLLNDFLRPAVSGAIRARVLLRAGQKDNAVASALKAVESLAADSPDSDRMRVAESLGYVGEKKKAVEQWKQVLQPDHVDPLVYLALDLARETGDDDFIMSFCKRLRGEGVHLPFTMELEVMTLEKYRIFDDAIAVMNEYLTATPDDELARTFRVRLSLLGIRLARPELIECDLTKLPPVESAPSKTGVATAYILRHGAYPERGVKYIYELVRHHFGDSLVRQAYVGIIGIGEEEYRFPDVSTVSPGCAVKYRADDSGEETWVIVEDAGDPRSDHEEISPDHIWAKEMSGQVVGGKFHLRRDPVQTRTATICGIVSKYAYRKFEIMDGWEKRFPDKFFLRKYTIPTNPDGSPDISLIFKALDLKEQQKQEMHALYRDNPISATTFARVTDAGLLESLSHLASEGTLPIRCCFGNDAELAQANAVLSSAERFILDPSALATLFFSNQSEQLQLLAGKIVLCESALDEYTELRRKFTNPSRGFVGKFKGKYLFREDDPGERERQEQRLEKFLTKIKLLVTTKTGESLAKLTPEARKELIDLFGEPTAQAMAEAATTGAVLWTDDLAVAEFGRERTGISKRVWTQLVFRSVTPPDVQHELALFLLQWRYFFTRVEPEVVLAACRVGSWEADSPAITSVADWLNQPELLDIGAVQICVQSLRLVWRHGPDVGHKQRMARLLLQAVRRRKDGRQAMAFILNNLGKIFEGDGSARSECNAVINDMQQDEKTPGEIAASKTAWAKVIKQMKNRMHESAKNRPAQSTPKQRADQRKADRKRKKGKR